MNQADILAEKVLDDILEETVLEMQRWASGRFLHALCKDTEVDKFAFGFSLHCLDYKYSLIFPARPVSSCEVIFSRFLVRPLGN